MARMYAVWEINVAWGATSLTMMGLEMLLP